MDEHDLHELAISYCETIYRNNPKVSAKKYMQSYLQAMKLFTKVLDKSLLMSMESREVINEIKENLSAIDEHDENN